MLDRRLTLNPDVALRPEPFGALAYNYGNRRLVFLKHPDVVTVVRTLSTHPADSTAELVDTLRDCGIEERRWPAFERAIASLEESEILRERTAVAPR